MPLRLENDEKLRHVHDCQVIVPLIKTRISTWGSRLARARARVRGFDINVNANADDCYQLRRLRRVIGATSEIRREIWPLRDVFATTITLLLSARSVIDIIGIADKSSRVHRYRAAIETVKKRGERQKKKREREREKRGEEEGGKKREERSSSDEQVCSNCERSVRATLEYSNSNYSADDPSVIDASAEEETLLNKQHVPAYNGTGSFSRTYCGHIWRIYRCETGPA